MLKFVVIQKVFKEQIKFVANMPVIPYKLTPKYFKS